MKKALVLLFALMMNGAAGFADGESIGGSIFIGNTDYVLLGDPATVLPAAVMGGSINAYIPYTMEWSTYAEGSAEGEYDFSSMVFGLMYGASCDLSYRKEILVLRAEVASRGDFSIGTTDRFLEITPGFQASIGDLDLSFTTRHSLSMVFEDTLSSVPVPAYVVMLGSAFPLFDQVVTEVEVAGIVKSNLWSISPSLKLSWYPGANAFLTGSVSIAKSVSTASPADPEYDFWKLSYSTELALFFFTRSHASLDVSGSLVWDANFAVLAEASVDPGITAEIELSDSFSMLIKIKTILSLFGTGGQAEYNGSGSILLKYSF
jgi:hypothetical protein